MIFPQAKAAVLIGAFITAFSSFPAFTEATATVTVTATRPNLFSYYNNEKSPLEIFKEHGSSWSRFYEALKEKANHSVEDLQYIKNELLSAQHSEGGKRKYLEATEKHYQKVLQEKKHQHEQAEEEYKKKNTEVKTKNVFRRFISFIKKKANREKKHPHHSSKKHYQEEEQQQCQITGAGEKCVKETTDSSQEHDHHQKTNDSNKYEEEETSSIADYNVEDEYLSVEQIQKLKEIAEAAKKYVEEKNARKYADETTTTVTYAATTTVTTLTTGAATTATTETSSTTVPTAAAETTIPVDQAMASSLDVIDESASVRVSATNPLLLMLTVLIPIFLVL